MPVLPNLSGTKSALASHTAFNGVWQMAASVMLRVLAEFTQMLLQVAELSGAKIDELRALINKNK